MLDMPLGSSRAVVGTHAGPSAIDRDLNRLPGPHA